MWRNYLLNIINVCYVEGKEYKSETASKMARDKYLVDIQQLRGGFASLILFISARWHLAAITFSSALSD